MIRIRRQRFVLLAVGIAALVLVVAVLGSSGDDESGGITTGDTRRSEVGRAANPSSSRPGAGSPDSSPGDGRVSPGGSSPTNGSVPGTNDGLGGAGTPGGPGAAQTPPTTGSHAAPTPTQPGPTPTSGPVLTIPPPGTGALGYVGCSLTRGAVEGYRQIGGTRFWPTAREYSGGTVEVWAKNRTNGSKYWAAFDAMNAAAPAGVVWWQLCAYAEPSDDATYNLALTVLEEIRRRIPGVTVYVSAENGWAAPHVCDVMGVGGPTRVRAITNRLANENGVPLGPFLGDMPLDKIAPDGCHPTMEGGRDLGAILLAFGF